MVKREPVFYWDKENGIATCYLIDNKGNMFIGEAFCHDDDRDMMSEKTGYEIAQRRAQIEFFTHIRDNEIKPAISILYELYNEMKNSKNFNAKSYENLSLQRKIRQKEFDLTVIREMLAREKESLKEYLAQKEIFYNQVRKQRNKAKQD